MDPDFMHRPKRNRLILAALFLSIFVPLVLPPVHSQQPRVPREKRSYSAPARTDAGEWGGTWFYQTHKEKWALWLRVEDGVPEVKFQFQNYDQGENFITDWQTVSHYASKEKKGLFKPIFDQRDIDLITGEWFWQLGTAEVDRAVRTETASFEMYRSGRGRQLVLALAGFERVYEGSRTYRLAAEQAWTFHKASRRLVDWNELPF